MQRGAHLPPAPRACSASFECARLRRDESRVWAADEQVFAAASAGELERVMQALRQGWDVNRVVWRRGWGVACARPTF